jgi:hypothetical protein
MPNTPTIALPTTTEFIARFKTRCIEKTAGKLSDFSDASALTLLAEVMSLSLEEDVQQYLNQIFPQLIAQSWGLLGFFPVSGAKAVGTARFLLASVQSQSFAIPRGYRFSAGGQTFETTLDLLIPANTDSANPTNYPLCRVQTIALVEGSNSNQPAQQCQILNPVVGLAGVFFDEATQGGRSLESFEAFADRVASTIRTAVGSAANRPVVTVTEHLDAAIEVLGSGAIAVGVPERNLQGQSQVAAMTVYVLTPSGAAPNNAQLGLLLQTVAPRAPLATGRLYYAPLPVLTLNIDISIKALPSADLEGLATIINGVVRSAFSLEKTAEMSALDINRLVQIIYDLDGIDYCDPQWGYQGDPILEARRLMLPLLPGSTVESAAAKVGRLRVIYTTGLQREFN